MAINPINPINIPAIPITNQVAQTRPKQPLPLDVGKTINTNVVSTDKLVIGIQNVEKGAHKAIEGINEKKLYI